MNLNLARRLAESLRRMRQEPGLTQSQMARRLGISQPTLNRLESASQNVTLRTLSQLCAALDCDIGDLFQGQVKVRRRVRDHRR